jgi:hypothetical protein
MKKLHWQMDPEAPLHPDCQHPHWRCRRQSARSSPAAAGGRAARRPGRRRAPHARAAGRRPARQPWEASSWPPAGPHLLLLQLLLLYQQLRPRIAQLPFGDAPERLDPVLRGEVSVAMIKVQGWSASTGAPVQPQCELSKAPAPRGRGAPAPAGQRCAPAPRCAGCAPAPRSSASARRRLPQRSRAPTAPPSCRPPRRCGAGPTPAATAGAEALRGCKLVLLCINQGV